MATNSQQFPLDPDVPEQIEPGPVRANVRTRVHESDESAWHAVAKAFVCREHVAARAPCRTCSNQMHLTIEFQAGEEESDSHTLADRGRRKYGERRQKRYRAAQRR